MGVVFELISALNKNSGPHISSMLVPPVCYLKSGAMRINRGLLRNKSVQTHNRLIMTPRVELFISKFCITDKMPALLIDLLQIGTKIHGSCAEHRFQLFSGLYRNSNAISISAWLGWQNY